MPPLRKLFRKLTQVWEFTCNKPDSNSISYPFKSEIYWMTQI